ncbi:MAG TPA: CRISPR-associated protein Cas4 [Anaerolineae bacterium]|nr:CRISPR-associated protein Cas4 [Anaerolineae bacterium]
MDQPDYLPIAMLNQLEYCPRRFWYMFVLGEMEVNAPVLEGTLQHERAHAVGTERQGQEVTQRRVYVYSDRLRLVGFVDLVEMKGGEIYPVEYKRGRMARWLNDHIQLCAQALCLEERTGKQIDHGFIFYFGSRRRQRVDFTPELRARTRVSIQRAFALLEEGKMPPPLENLRKCRDCSLEPVCLPKEVRQLCPRST